MFVGLGPLEKETKVFGGTKEPEFWGNNTRVDSRKRNLVYKNTVGWKELREGPFPGTAGVRRDCVYGLEKCVWICLNVACVCV